MSTTQPLTIRCCCSAVHCSRADTHASGQALIRCAANLARATNMGFRTDLKIANKQRVRSTGDDCHVNRQTALRGFLILGLHIQAGLAHGLNDRIERDNVLAVARQSQ